jgi:argininosuccinate lyase
LYVRAGIDQIQIQLAAWLEVLLDRAEQSKDAAMPAYTHLQRAEPVLVAHWLLAYVEMFLRDAGRLADCRIRLNVCPLGSGAVAGASLPLNRSVMAKELDFFGITANSIDATSDRDFVIECVSSLSLLALHLSRWSEEMILFSSKEFGFVVAPDLYSTGSSAMPQKKNADLLELTRGKSARILGDATALATSLKGLPLAYNKDLQEMQEPLFHAADTVISLLPLVTGWMRSADFSYDSMQRAAQTGFMNAWAAATYLVQRGIPFRQAHENIGKAVHLCLEIGCELQDLPLTELKQFNAAFDEDVYDALTLESVLSIHDVPGGTSPTRVRQALADARRKVNSILGGLHAHA